jgi:hypothetical protein
VSDTSALDEVVLRLLTEAAEAGLKCPSNVEIAAAADMASPSTGPRVIKRLARHGLIEVETGQHARVVTIVATGKRTAGVAGRTHWRYRPENRHKLKRNYAPLKPKVETATLSEPNPTRVHRDPCPRCGVREDVGCAHVQPAPDLWVHYSTRRIGDSLPADSGA